MDKQVSHTITPVGEHGQHPARIQGRAKQIVLAFAVMTIPMLAFSGVLLGLVFHFRVVQNGFVSDRLAFDAEQEDSNAIFVKISATTLITVASWSSTVAPILIGFAITLISYPIASAILSASQKNSNSNLPTPYQLSLLLQTLTSGSLSSLWSWLKYSFGWKGQRKGQGKPLKLLFSILILATILSALVLATDTWLHLSTKTVNFVQPIPSTTLLDLAFGLTSRCSQVNQTFFVGCNLNNPASGATLLNGALELKVLSNISDTMLVQTHTVGDDQYAYMGSPQQPDLANIDYTASSSAVKSHCVPVTSECIDPNDVGGVGTRYKCPFAFQGTANTAVGSSSSLTMAYFTDASGSNNNTDTYSIANPYYFSALAVINQKIPRSPGLGNDPQIVAGGHGGVMIALFCNATVYDIEYTSVNGTITRFLTSLSNSSTTNIVQGSQRTTQVGTPNLIQAASVAGLGDTANDIANSLALSYSQTALAVAAAAFEKRAVSECQVREELLVAKVPKAPLAALIIANLLLVSLGLVLTIVAFFTARGDTGEVQARLSLPALVASKFEHVYSKQPVKAVEELFGERQGGSEGRVGFVKSSTGVWEFDVR